MYIVCATVLSLGTKSLEGHIQSTIIVQLLCDSYECCFVLVFGHIYIRKMAKQYTYQCVIEFDSFDILSISLHYKYTWDFRDSSLVSFTYVWWLPLIKKYSYHYFSMANLYNWLNLPTKYNILYIIYMQYIIHWCTVW